MQGAFAKETDCLAACQQPRSASGLQPGVPGNKGLSLARLHRDVGEKEAALKRQDKLQKRKADDSKKDTSLGVKATATKKTKKKAIRIKKNVVIRVRAHFDYVLAQSSWQ